MDEKKVLKLKVLDKADCELRAKQHAGLRDVADPLNASNQDAERKIVHPNQTNPIYKNLAKFNNAKIGDKWSVKDLLR